MARKKLTHEEEERLVQEVESYRGRVGEAWDLSRPKRLRVATGATAVVSARVPFEQLKALREIAERERTSLSELTKQAIDLFIAASGPTVSMSERHGSKRTVYLRDAPLTETYQPGEREVRNEDESFKRPNRGDTDAS